MNRHAFTVAIAGITACAPRNARRLNVFNWSAYEPKSCARGLLQAQSKSKNCSTVN